MKYFNNQSSPLRGKRGGLLFYLLLPLFALTLTSCGDNEEEGNIPDPYAKTDYLLQYWFEPNAGFCEYYDITATYLTLDGQKVEVAVTDKAPLKYEEKKAIKDVPNFKFYCNVNARLKAGINPDEIPDDLKGDFLYQYELGAYETDGTGERYVMGLKTSKHLDPYKGDSTYEKGITGTNVKNFLTTYPSYSFATLSSEEG